MAVPHGAGTVAAITLLGLVAGAGCHEGRDARRQQAAQSVGDADRGQRLIRKFHCGSCHAIPGVRGANGAVGPPLSSFAHRVYIAGQVPNTPDNLMRWVIDPPSIAPGTAMPTLGLDERDARDVAAYLYTLR